MPPRSQAQRGAMAEAEQGNSDLGIPQGVGEEYMDEDPGGLLPRRAPKKGKGRGLQALIDRRGKK